MNPAKKFDKRGRGEYISFMPDFPAVLMKTMDQSSDLYDKTCNSYQPFKIPKTERAWNDCARTMGTILFARSAFSLSGGLASAFSCSGERSVLFFAFFCLPCKIGLSTSQ